MASTIYAGSMKFTSTDGYWYYNEVGQLYTRDGNVLRSASSNEVIYIGGGGSRSIVMEYIISFMAFGLFFVFVYFLSEYLLRLIGAPYTEEIGTILGLMSGLLIMYYLGPFKEWDWKSTFSTFPMAVIAFAGTYLYLYNTDPSPLILWPAGAALIAWWISNKLMKRVRRKCTE